MDIETLTRYMDEFVNVKGWYNPNSPRPQTLKNLSISLVLEATEVLEHFQWRETLEDKVSFADELADVALYLLQIAKLAEIDLEKAIIDKLAKNYGREWDIEGNLE